MKRWTPIFLRARFAPLIGAMLACALFGAPALAADQPFDLESSSWMSFDRYKDRPSHWLAPDQRATVQAQPVIAPPPVLPASMPNLKEPEKPVETPPLPGLNKNFDIRVDSTEDDHRMSIVRPDKDDNKDDDALPDSNWKSAADVAHQSKPDNNKIEGGDSSSPNVRFTSLPSWFVPPHKADKPAMTPAPVKAAPPAVKVAQPAPSPAPPVSKADAVACAALDAYKKHQLEAIESDRQTLTALQNAIAQLGLQKQLDFLPGVNGSLQTAGSGPAKN